MDHADFYIYSKVYKVKFLLLSGQKFSNICKTRLLLFCSPIHAFNQQESDKIHSQVFVSPAAWPGFRVDFEHRNSGS